MPSIDLLLPPLLGGYIFITRFNGTSFRCSSYSGYRLFFASAVFGMVFLFAAAAAIHLVKLSTDPIVLHELVFPTTMVGGLLVVFGSWKSIRASKQPTQKLNTDSPGEYETRVAAQKQALVFSRIVFYVVSILAIFVALHALQSLSGLAVSLFGVSTITLALATVACVNVLKKLSSLHGYEVSFRLGILVLAAVAVFTASYSFSSSITATWQAIVPIKHSGVAIIAFLIGATLWFPANWLYPYDAAVERLAEQGKLDGLEELFYYAMITFQPVCVTLSDGKAYVGYIDREIPIAGIADSYVLIVPMASGFREPRSKRLVLDTFYLDAFDEAIRQGSDLSVDDIGKVVPIAEIRTAGVFDQAMYRAFRNLTGDDSMPLLSAPAGIVES